MERLLASPRPIAVGMAVGLLAALVACQNGVETPFGRADTELRSTLPSPRASLQVPLPRVSCAESVARVQRIIERVGIAPGRSWVPPFRWHPDRLSDLDLDANGYVLLDAGKREVSFLSPTLRPRTTTRLSGIVAPESSFRALSLGPNSTLWVLDIFAGEVSEFDRSGRPLRPPIPVGTASDLLVDSTDNVFLARPLAPQEVEGSERDRVQLVGKLVPEGDTIKPYIEIPRREVVPPRFILPLHNPVRIRKRGGWLAVSFPAAGWVDVYWRSELVYSVQVCMPPELKARYAEQMRDADGTQRWFPLITDVFIEPDGSIRTIGPLPDSANMYHLQRFDSGGRFQGSIAFPAHTVRLPPEVRFNADASELVAFSPASGIVAALQLVEP